MPVEGSTSDKYAFDILSLFKNPLVIFSISLSLSTSQTLSLIDAI